MLLILPVSYIVIKLGAAPYAVFIVHIVMSAVAFTARLRMGSVVTGFLCMDFIKRVLLPIIGVVIISAIIPLLIHFAMPLGWIRMLVVGCISVLSVAVGVYLIGLQHNEKEILLNFIRKKY